MNLPANKRYAHSILPVGQNFVDVSQIVAITQPFLTSTGDAYVFNVLLKSGGNVLSEPQQFIDKAYKERIALMEKIGWIFDVKPEEEKKQINFGINDIVENTVFDDPKLLVVVKESDPDSISFSGVVLNGPYQGEYQQNYLKTEFIIIHKNG